MDIFRIMISLCLLCLLTFDVDMSQCSACLCLFYFVGADIVLG
jgi:hypothetical protein